MRIAAIADIHGNSAALDAVLDDIARAGADLTVNLGDCFSGPLDARGTAERLLPLGLPTVAGNHDRWLIDRPATEMGSWDAAAHRQLLPAHLDWLRALPATRAVEGLFLCHGTPSSDTANWLDIAGGGTMRIAPRAAIEREAAGIAGETFLCAHTHVQRALRLGDGRLVVNPGSVGCPAYAVPREPDPYTLSTGAPDARYAILERRGGVWQVELRMVPYDPAPMAALARAAGWDDWVEMVSTGWIEINA